jgi:hypothetical protein
MQIRKKQCLENSNQEPLECRDGCDQGNLIRIEKSKCRRECSKERINENIECHKTICLKDCKNTRKNWTNSLRLRYTKCREKGKELPALISMKKCEDGEGFYHKICNGP